MKRVLTTFVMFTAVGCATQQTVSLLPRGAGTRGTGVFDHIHQVLTVDLNGQRYQGQPISQTATTSSSIYRAGATTTTNQQTALLIGNNGQIRCEFMWDQFKTMANGTCVDSNNTTYDLLIKNP